MSLDPSDLERPCGNKRRLMVEAQIQGQASRRTKPVRLQDAGARLAPVPPSQENVVDRLACEP